MPRNTPDRTRESPRSFHVAVPRSDHVTQPTRGDVQNDTIDRRFGFYDANDRKKESVMLSVIVVVLLVLWLLGMATSYTMGGILHLLLVVAIAAALLRIMEGRNPIRG
jgi:uncharacterized protein DUF5670